MERVGCAAGTAYVAASSVAASLNGNAPARDATNEAVQTFFVDHRTSVIAQGWLYALATALVMWFAVAVRGILYTAPNGKHLGDLFLVCTARSRR